MKCHSFNNTNRALHSLKMKSHSFNNTNRALQLTLNTHISLFLILPLSNFQFKVSLNSTNHLIISDPTSCLIFKKISGHRLIRNLVDYNVDGFIDLLSFSLKILENILNTKYSLKHMVSFLKRQNNKFIQEIQNKT